MTDSPLSWNATRPAAPSIRTLVDGWRSVYELARTYAARYPDREPTWVAEKAVGDLSATDRRAMLVTLLADEVASAQRVRVHAIEQAAVEAATRAVWESDRTHPRYANRNSKRFKAWAASPEGIAYLTEETATCDHLTIMCPHPRVVKEAARAARDAEWERDPGNAPAGSKVYKRWLTETEEGRALAADKADREEQRRLFREDWPAWDAKYGVSAVMRKYRDDVRLELTKELLGASFALGDGNQVTWGAATLDEHRQRIELLMGNVSGNLATIRLHEIAAETLRETHAACLDDVKAAQVAS